MANVGTGTIGKTLIAQGVGISPTYKTIGSDSSLAAHGVVLAQGTGPFTVSSPLTVGHAFISNGASSDPTFGVLGPSGGGTGLATITGVITGNGTSAFTASTLTQYATLVGAASNLIGSVGPSATAGQIYQSGGASANPAFSTATYPSSTTVSQILYSSAANVVSGLATANDGVLITSHTGVPSLLANGTTGQILTATTGAPPSWAANAAFTVLGVQRITTTGTSTYTPTAGTKYARVTLVGAGGGSGGCAATTGNIAISGAGGGGATAVFLLTAAQIGASLSVTVGAGGTGGTAGNNAGANGGSTSIASPNWVAAGGSGGAGSAAATTISRVGANGGAVSTSTGTLVRSSSGNGGSNGFGTASTFVVGGFGGASGLCMGMGGLAVSVTLVSGTSTSTALVGVGGGAGGSVAFGTNGTVAGTAGADGIAIFEEFG